MDPNAVDLLLRGGRVHTVSGGDAEAVAVRGGRVIADWPGLAQKDRFEGRDLQTTTDLRALFKTVLADHLRVARSAIDTTVLPSATAVRPLDLLRG